MRNNHFNLPALAGKVFENTLTLLGMTPRQHRNSPMPIRIDKNRAKRRVRR